MYEIRTKLPNGHDVSNQVIYELVELFEPNGQDCTCGVADGAVIGFVDEDMLGKVTSLLLRYVAKVEVQTGHEDKDELVTA
jgi:hypothetical protein